VEDEEGEERWMHIVCTVFVCVFWGQSLDECFVVGRTPSDHAALVGGFK